MENKSESGNSFSPNDDREMETRHTREPLRILMLAANPIDRYRLALTDEYRLLRDNMYPNSEAGACNLHMEWAASAKHLQGALKTVKPHILHFSGHADGNCICLEDDERKSHPLTKRELGLLFSQSRSWLRVVVLNGCDSARQGDSLTELVDFIVGTNIPITDQIALQFTSDFYRAIAKGDTVREAFNKAQKNTPPGAYELVARPGADETTPLLPPTASSLIDIDAGETEANVFNAAGKIIEGPTAAVDRTPAQNETSVLRMRTRRLKAKTINLAGMITKQGKN